MLLKDFAFAFRSLRKSPGFFLTAITLRDGRLELARHGHRLRSGQGDGGQRQCRRDA